MATIDLQDASFHLSIHPSSRKYLRFAVDNAHYQYKALPFGLSSSPRVFTKCMVVIAAHLRFQEIKVFQYIDNWLLLVRSKACLSSNIATTIDLLNSLGIMMKHKKSCLEPCKRLQYIGAVLNSRKMIAFLPRDRAFTLKDLAQYVKSSRSSSALHIQHFLELMAAAIIVVPHARRFMRPLQLWFLRIFNPLQDYQTRLLFPPC